MLQIFFEHVVYTSPCTKYWDYIWKQQGQNLCSSRVYVLRVEDKQANYVMIEIKWRGENCSLERGNQDLQVRSLAISLAWSRQASWVGNMSVNPRSKWRRGHSGIRVCVQSLSCVRLFCHPMDYNPPGSSVHGILQPRTPEWVAISFSRASFWPRNQTWPIFCIAGGFFTVEPLGNGNRYLKEQQSQQGGNSQCKGFEAKVSFVLETARGQHGGKETGDEVRHGWVGGMLDEAREDSAGICKVFGFYSEWTGQPVEGFEQTSAMFWVKF